MCTESLSPNAVVMKSVKIACASIIPGALNEDFLGEVSVRLTAPEAQDRASYWLKLGDWGRCPLRVKSRHAQPKSRCPLCANSGHSDSRALTKRNPGTLPGVFHGLGQLHLNVEFKASNRAGIAVQLPAKFYPKKRRRRATQLLLWLSVKCKRTLIASSAKGIAYRRR